MTFSGLDPNETRDVGAFGKKWRIGVVPAGMLSELSMRAARLGLDAETDDAREALAVRLGAEVFPEWLRWGLRAVDGREVATDTAKCGGETFAVVPRDLCRRLARVDDGILAMTLVRHIREANTLSADAALGFS